MIERIMNTGDQGRLRIIDRTDEAGRTVEFWIRSLSPVSIPQLPWAYSVDGVKTSWKSFNFASTTVWQKLGVIYVGYAQQVVLHLGTTGKPQLGGPTDFLVDLLGGISTCTIVVDGVPKKAIAFVNVEGEWKTATMLVQHNSVWKETV